MDVPLARTELDVQVADDEDRRTLLRRRLSVACSDDGERHRPPSRLGSRSSCRPSPRRLKPMTVMNMKIAGQIAIQGATVTSGRASLIIRPQSEAGGCAPRPRKLRDAPSRIPNVNWSPASTV